MRLAKGGKGYPKVPLCRCSATSLIIFIFLYVSVFILS